MKQVQMYEAVDGTVFYDKGECRAYETKLFKQGQVKQFLKSEECPYAQGTGPATIAKTTIEKWIEWESKQPEDGYAEVTPEAVPVVGGETEADLAAEES